MRKLLILLVVFFGCASVKEVEEINLNNKSLLPEEVINNVNSFAYTINNCKTNGTIEVNFDSLSITLEFTSYLKNRDTLKIDLTGPFGLELGSALITKNYFLIYNKFENIVLEGIVDLSKLPISIPPSFKVDELFSFFANVRLLPLNSEITTNEINKSFIIKTNSNNLSSTYFVENGMLSKVSHNKETKNILNEYYSYENNNLKYFNSVVLETPQNKRQIKINYNSIEYNIEMPSLMFEVDNKAKRKSI
ncbi:MAG: DUF4292 domain-containing protein [Bacteroidetes bacterium]|nr:DUF4292 domain-containing protein [Bacteroidota bacterium]